MAALLALYKSTLDQFAAVKTGSVPSKGLLIAVFCVLKVVTTTNGILQKVVVSGEVRLLYAASSHAPTASRLTRSLRRTTRRCSCPSTETSPPSLCCSFSRGAGSRRRPFSPNVAIGQ